MAAQEETRHPRRQVGGDTQSISCAQVDTQTQPPCFAILCSSMLALVWRRRCVRVNSPSTYKDMIKKALADLSKYNGGEVQGTFKEICQTMKKLFAKKLNWKASGYVHSQYPLRKNNGFLSGAIFLMPPETMKEIGARSFPMHALCV